MDEATPPTHSFVVKIWAEELGDEDEAPTWRGRVTHAKSGEDAYLDSLVELPKFLAAYVEQFGGTLDERTRRCIRLASRSSSKLPKK